MNEIIKIVESLGKSSLLNDGATETVKHEIRKKKVGLWAYEPRFNGVFSRDNLPSTKSGVYVINLDVEKVKKHNGFIIF